MTLTPPSSECALCEDTGYRGWKTPAAGYSLKEVSFCECGRGVATKSFWLRKEGEVHQRRLSELFVHAGIPAHFRDMTIDTLTERAGTDKNKHDAIQAACDLMNNGFLVDPRTQRVKPGLVLSGEYGRGKTGLLTPVLRHFIGQGKTGLWIEVYDFFTEVQKGYSDGESNARLEAAQKTDVVLLDDLGDKSRDKEETDDRRRILYQLVNYRHNHGLPMLITTNLTGKEAAMQFGARTFERIVESCVWVNMGGKNLRLE